MILADAATALRFFQLLRAARAQRLAGHVWARVDVRPGRPTTVSPRRYVPGDPLPPALPGGAR